MRAQQNVKKMGRHQPGAGDRKTDRRTLGLLFLSLGWLPRSSAPPRPEPPSNPRASISASSPAGYYLLGSPVSEPGRYADEDTPHRVRVDAFYIAVTETTNAQYRRFLKATGHQPPLYWEDKNLNGPNQPVVGVTWDDAVAFCRWLTQVTGVSHSLPSEAQWEAAARGGLTGQPYPWGAEAPDAGGVYRANLRHDRTGKDGYLFTAPVGSFPANGYGLFDLAGNVSGMVPGPVCAGRLRAFQTGAAAPV